MADGMMIRVGHVLDELAKMAPESVSCCVTSPPYWSLRKYDAPDAVWGGSADCPHTLEAAPMQGEGYVGTGRWQHSGVSREETPEAWVKETVKDKHYDFGTSTLSGTNEHQMKASSFEAEVATCSRCGAWRGQYGLEPTPELYVQHSIDVLRAIRRVLRPDGVVWWNIGDGYASSPSGNQKWTGWETGGVKDATSNYEKRSTVGGTLKPKDLVLMPERIALAAQADGWWVRKRIVWHKPNAMPESCTDRPSSAHETIWMLTKSARYWYDQEAVRESRAEPDRVTDGFRNGGAYVEQRGIQDNSTRNVEYEGVEKDIGSSRNMRDVWTFPTAQTPEAHFATFPEELPRRCIEASCPREVCVKCGTARVRIVERRGLEEHPARRDRSVRNKADFDGEDYARRDSTLGLVANDVTTGWTECGCEKPDYQPGIVLDPFAGIGTTGVVARRLGRRFVGIELSEKYAAMAEEKLAQYWRKVTLTEPERDESQGVLAL